jgi:uncharacterized protein YndB with AHSA1/START domain
MKENILKIVINRPVEKVFEFTTNPANTPLWNDMIAGEQADLPLQVGGKYNSRNKFDEVSKYEISKLVPNEVFELKALDSEYTVGYLYKAVEANVTELEYFELAPSQDWSEPFTHETLAKLKTIMEAR